MDVIHSVVPRGEGDFDDRDPEEIKGQHSRQMRAWQQQMTQANLRGGGATNTNYMFQQRQPYAGYQTRGENSSTRLQQYAV